MFSAMCQDTRQKNGFTRGSRNCQATAVFEHFISQAHTKAVASVANQPSMKGHFDAACAKENDCILAHAYAYTTIPEVRNPSAITDVCFLGGREGCGALYFCVQCLECDKFKAYIQKQI